MRLLSLRLVPRRTDEIVLAQPTHVVSGVADYATVVVDAEVGVVAFAVGRVDQGFHEQMPTRPFILGRAGWS